jgi:signal transduction histidine kinase/ligand-binding sensor domain-containing protein/AraC-like DNA-binding protein/FixJ family two-component response regulator
MLQTKLLLRSLTALIILYFYTAEISPQGNPFHFDHISIDQGLPTNSINCVYQDRKGFIWIGTDKGLARYDGYNFKMYRHNKNDYTSLSDDFVTSILEDSAGNFWIGTQKGGLNKFDRFLNKFSSLKHIPYDTNSISNNNITTLIENKGNIWVGTQAGFSKLSSSGNKFTNYYVSDSVYSNKSISYLTNNGFVHIAVSKIIKDSGTLWIGTLCGLTELNLRNNSFSSYLFDRNREFHIRSLIKEDESNLLISSAEGLYRFSKINKQFQQLLQEPINDLMKTREGKLWCATDGNGIYLYDIQKGTKDTFNKDTGFSNGIVSASYQSIFTDRAGSIWFTSLNNGINILNPVNKQFIVFNHDPKNTNSLSFNIVNRGFTDKNNTTWFPTYGGGLDKYSAEEKSFVHLKESLLKEDKINSVIRDDFGRLWVGTNNGLYNLRFSNPSFEKISFGDNIINDRPVNTIEEDREGNIWAGIDDNLVKYSPLKNETMIINLKRDSTSAIYNLNISGILTDNDNLWVSTSNGLYKYNIKKNSLNLFRDTDPYEIENQFCTLIQDWEGLIWLGSKGGGLKCFNPQTGAFISYVIENGLPSNNILSIQEDAEGYLWLGTDKGLVNFNYKGGGVIVYTISDGIPSNKFIPNSSWVSSSGEFFFGTENGVVSFFPANIISNKFVPPVVLTSFKIFNKDVALNYETSYITELEIPYQQNILSFEIAALNFIDPQRNQYAYMLEGFNNKWSYIKSQHEISFTDLGPGTYILRIKASNNDGLWNESGLSLKLIILPPWYRTWWAYIIYLILIICVYLGLKKYELNKVMLKNELKLKKLESAIQLEADKVKSDFFKKISHDLKTPLSMIIDPVSVLKEKLNDPNDKKNLALIEQNAQSLIQQINRLIDLSELEAGSIKLMVSRNDLIPFLRGLIMNFEPAAKLKNIELALHLPMDHLNIYFDTDKLERILFHLISNAIKYTPERGSIIVAVELRSERVYIKVKDSGIGIPAEKYDRILNLFQKKTPDSAKETRGLGIGLALTKKLVELHKGEIQVTSTPGIGTTFTFWINTNEKIYHYTEIAEVNTVNLTFRPLSKEQDISTVFQDYSEKQIVLLIEDNPNIRRLISSQLEENYAVYEYPNSAKGFEKAKEIIPDIILIDALNSGMDGNEFCSLVKNDENTGHIPIILIRENNSLNNKVTGEETGADDYLEKPFNKLDILMKIKNLISIRRKFRDILCRETITGIKPVIGSEIKLGKADKSFIKKVVQVVENNYSHFEFNIEEFCNYTGMGQAALRRKMSAIFNKSPNEFILKFRLYKAEKLIKEEGKTGAEAANAVGFDNLSYFSKCYRAEFGKLPPESGN